MTTGFSSDPGPDAKDLPMLQFVGALVSAAAEIPRIVDRLRALEVRLNGLAEGRPSLQSQIEQIRASTSGVETALAGLVQRQDCLEAASAERARFTEHQYQEHIIRPLVSHLVPIYQWATDVLARLQEPHASNEDAAGRVLTAAQSQIMELLAAYGVETLNAAPGAPYDARTMRAEGSFLPDGAGRPLVVSGSVRIGFRLGDRVLSPQVVTVRPAKEK